MTRYADDLQGHCRKQHQGITKENDVSMLIADNEKSNNEITLEQLPEMALFQNVIVTVKAIKSATLYSLLKR